MSRNMSKKAAAEIMIEVERMLLCKSRIYMSDLLELVPTGTRDEAVGKEGTFGLNGIHKYVFRSSDFERVCVKWHLPDVKAVANGGAECNSYLFCTFQISIGHKQVEWNEEERKVSWRRTSSNRTHIPMEPFMA